LVDSARVSRSKRKPAGAPQSTPTGTKSGTSEAAEEDHSPVACATFLVGGGRGDHSYEPMHRY
jgi:hypothetical protein